MYGRRMPLYPSRASAATAAARFAVRRAQGRARPSGRRRPEADGPDPWGIRSWRVAARWL